jgi:hypothetical protein
LSIAYCQWEVPAVERVVAFLCLPAARAAR